MTLDDLQELVGGTMLIVAGKLAMLERPAGHRHLTVLYEDGSRGIITEEWQAEAIRLMPLDRTGSTPRKG